MHHPPPNVPCDLIDATQQLAATRNPLGMLTGVIPNNNVPNLDDEVTAIVTGSHPRGNCLRIMIAVMQSVSLLPPAVTSLAHSLPL